jgi:putative SOS response-associated peptidase YedK
MCGRFDTSKFTWREIHDALNSLFPVKTPALNLEANDDVRPTTSQLVARIDGDGWAVDKMRWGLVPGWRSGKPLKNSANGAKDGFNLTTFNARTENFMPGAKRSAVFADSFAKRRCVVPASGWYEWTGPEGKKTKHRFARADGQPLWFAGIWDRCTTPDAGEFASFTILTGPSAGWLAHYHDRAPVILEPYEWSAWLDPAQDAGELLAAIRPDRFELAAAA